MYLPQKWELIGFEGFCYKQFAQRPVVGSETARRAGQSALVVSLAEKASLRLYKKFHNLYLKGKYLLKTKKR
ncbi:hypothetical protein DQM68_07630 [Leptospira mayottensis]|uniref:Uncharacterized protein n=2 Tax=Leptospira mayottensis TaxID=1137606 RepID=A0AA87MN05_9LEPT|nr:hypothetical protein DQM68_07630 [Leptospira mayottensis]AXR64381.1 hypothetical protein DQM28_09315 [Leptospira mayottensis]AZQ02997.1 hypothetical protein LEP1GSC190_14055 [Leptospira mayottensis 200901116]EKR98647.1 hypothetical protein LEP1GSC125_1679 [Leptospira mayottensis 200901122]TGN02305.1 hypothetical protein EHR03_12520 [Leptospira mayottensis]